MKIPSWLLIGGAAIAAWYYAGLVKAANLAQIVFSGVTINGLLDYTASFTVQNTTNSTIVLNSLAGSLLANGTEIANINLFPPQPILIPGNSQQIVNVDVKPNLINIPSAVLQALQAGSTPISFEAQGSANINNITVPFDITESFAV